MTSTSWEPLKAIYTSYDKKQGKEIKLDIDNAEEDCALQFVFTIPTCPTLLSLTLLFINPSHPKIPSVRWEKLK